LVRAQTGCKQLSAADHSVLLRGELPDHTVSWTFPAHSRKRRLISEFAPIRVDVRATGY